MKLFKRKNYLTLHLYISLFFIPMALIYKITGIVCIIGYRGDVKTQEIPLNDAQKASLQSIIESSLNPKLPQDSKADSIESSTESKTDSKESNLAQNTKDSKNTESKVESKEPKPQEISKESLESLRIKFLQFLINNHLEIPTSTTLQEFWNKKEFTLGSSAFRINFEKNNPQKLIIRKNDWLANLVTLHFANAGVAFNVLAFSFVIFMFITYVTGLLLCDFKRNGKKYFTAILIGFITTTALALHGLYFW